jgi:tyrosyl-tRNA synthetase
MFGFSKNGNIDTDKSKIEHLLTHNVVEIIGEDVLRKKLLSRKGLRVKFGVDVSRPDLHIGHAVALRKLREFQDMGHVVIFLIGDATTRVGDPTGKDKTRPFLTEEEIQNNVKTYRNQVGLVLDISKIEIRYNSEWFGKMKMFDFMKLLTEVTHSQIINREAFQKRIKEGKEIFAHELVYSIMQGYDSVVLKADVAVHADQLFNEHFGRMYQEKYGQEPQAIMTLPILVGLDGKEKMSKSLDNYIGITDEPNDMYGKVMSIPDSVIIQYFELTTDISDKEIKNIKSELDSGKNPRDIKINLAFEIVSMYHGKHSADKAKENFISTFSKGGVPENMDEVIVAKGTHLFDAVSRNVKSKSDLRRLIAGNAVSDARGNVIKDINLKIENNIILKIGKRRFLNIKVKS